MKYKAAGQCFLKDCPEKSVKSSIDLSTYKILKATGR
jgi:hypothetical protein